MKYQRITLKNGAIRYRAQPRDPVTKKRLNVEAGSLEELRQRLGRIKQTADELRWGGLTPKDAAQRIKPALSSGPLNVETLWQRYLRVLPSASHKLAEQNWRFRLKKHFANSLPDSLTRDVMAEWQQDLKKANYAPKTIMNAYNHLAGCMRTAIDGGIIDDLPWGSVSRFSGGTGWRPDPPKSVKNQQFVGSIEQAVALIMVAKAKDEQNWKRGRYSDYAASVAVFMLSGLRQAELCALAWDSLQLDNPPFLLRVTCQAGRGWQKSGRDRPFAPTKGKKNQTQSLHLTVVQVLRAQRAELKRRGWYRFDGPVFPGVAGAWRTSGRVIIPEKMKQFAKACGFPHWEEWVTHSLRHSFATLEVKSSGDLKRTQARTGHSSVKQLEIYLHSTGAFLGESAIPELPIRLDPVRTLTDGTEVTAKVWPAINPIKAPDRDPDVPGDPWGFDMIPAATDVTGLTFSMAKDYDTQLRDSKREVRADSERKFSDIAREWVQSPERTRSGIPKSVAVTIHRNYCQAYRAEERAGGTKEKCRRAGKFKARACKGAWARAVSIEEKKLTAATEHLRSKPCDPDRESPS
jgi:integrase